MTEPSASQEPKSTSYWMITLLFWALIAFMVVVSIWSLQSGQTASFIGFLVFVAILLLTAHPPKWFQRFTSS